MHSFPIKIKQGIHFLLFKFNRTENLFISYYNLIGIHSFPIKIKQEFISCYLNLIEFIHFLLKFNRNYSFPIIIKKN